MPLHKPDTGIFHQERHKYSRHEDGGRRGLVSELSETFILKHEIRVGEEVDESGGDDDAGAELAQNSKNEVLWRNEGGHQDGPKHTNRTRYQHDEQQTNAQLDVVVTVDQLTVLSGGFVYPIALTVSVSCQSIILFSMSSQAKGLTQRLRGNGSFSLWRKLVRTSPLHGRGRDRRLPPRLTPVKRRPRRRWGRGRCYNNSSAWPYAGLLGQHIRFGIVDVAPGERGWDVRCRSCSSVYYILDCASHTFSALVVSISLLTHIVEPELTLWSLHEDDTRR